MYCTLDGFDCIFLLQSFDTFMAFFPCYNFLSFAVEYVNYIMNKLCECKMIYHEIVFNMALDIRERAE